MKTLIAIILALSLLAGCGIVDRRMASLTGAASKTCVDGVTYLQFTSGSTVQVDRDGKPVPCDD